MASIYRRGPYQWQVLIRRNGGDLPHVVRFALETAMRRGVIAGMTWDDVNFKKKTITLPNTKNGERRVVSLSSEAVGILSAIPRRIDGRVFGYTDPHSITWAFIHACKRAGIEDLTFHDLRISGTKRHQGFLNWGSARKK